jgi:hypothetical protein
MENSAPYPLRYPIQVPLIIDISLPKVGKKRRKKQEILFFKEN